MTADVAIGPGDVTKLGIGLTIALVVVAVLIVLVAKAVIVRLLTVVVVIILGVLVWQQRNHVHDAYNTHSCNLNATYFGIHVDAPGDLKRTCAAQR